MAVFLSKRKGMIDIPCICYVFHVPAGIEFACLNGCLAWCTSLWQCLLSGEKSTVLLGLPSAFLLMTILWQQAESSPKGSFSRTHNATPLFICSSTSSRQCKGTIARVLQAIGLAEGLTCSYISGPIRGWLGQVFNVEEEKRLMIHFFILSLSGMYSIGSSFGRGWGRVRGLQLCGFALTFKAPHFQLLFSIFSSYEWEIFGNHFQLYRLVWKSKIFLC